MPRYVSVGTVDNEAIFEPAKRDHSFHLAQLLIFGFEDGLKGLVVARNWMIVVDLCG